MSSIGDSGPTAASILETELLPPQLTELIYNCATVCCTTAVRRAANSKAVVVSLLQDLWQLFHHNLQPPFGTGSALHS